MNKDLQKLLFLGLSVYGVIGAASSFSSKLNTVERVGLTISSGVALFFAGYVLLDQIEDATDQFKRLV